MLVYNEIEASVVIFNKWVIHSNVCWIGQNTIVHKLKQLYKHLLVGFLIDIAYTANFYNILYKLYTKMAVYF